MTFEQVRKKCPWHYRMHNYAHTEICRGSSFVVSVSPANLQPDFRKGGSNLICNRKNCAIWYWIKAGRIK